MDFDQAAFEAAWKLIEETGVAINDPILFGYPGGSRPTGVLYLTGPAPVMWPEVAQRNTRRHQRRNKARRAR